MDELEQQIHLRTAAVAPERGTRPEWLQVVWTVNDLQPETFGRPDYLGPWWAGGSVEEYPDARVIHRGDGTVSIVSKTPTGARLLSEAAQILGIHANPLIEHRALGEKQ